MSLKGERECVDMSVSVSVKMHHSLFYCMAVSSSFSVSVSLYLSFSSSSLFFLDLPIWRLNLVFFILAIRYCEFGMKYFLKKAYTVQ